jgi:hypothetical protein
MSVSTSAPALAVGQVLVFAAEVGAELVASLLLGGMEIFDGRSDHLGRTGQRRRQLGPVGRIQRGGQVDESGHVEVFQYMDE